MGIAYVCYPSEDVGVETYVVLRDVDTALYQYLPLQRTSIIYEKSLSSATPTPDKKTHLQSNNPHPVYSKTNHENPRSAYC